ncbi:FtsP/CotA-like multicopper oxidase with cupredoxin domain [Evansella vedderi]|uniref:FtsP/CotA-like multicopper oxidase with cupredoxin domain n=1 Tax=Evansella vedderi TaxID=38282 RepID=A0ABT9ZY14_9BACI|nr:multicopper oxidase family protein [Evansella vedderi]MDQ0255612.1 FtsP/CotA-like multicopper oxidase with cupredoxin domain [Evansella vedderi]
MKLILKPMILLTVFIIILAGCSTSTMDHSDMDHSQMDHTNEVEEQNETQQVERSDGKVVVNLEAKKTHWMFNNDIIEDIWTYNGSLPGQEIRVQEGDHVVINLTNSLDVPTALHPHGVPVPNEMDGVPGVTQNAIMPGETFTYEFVADTPGTYWYHSHQDGANQLGMGLYGALVIEPKDQPDYDLDKVIMIDEWSSMGMENMDHRDMDHGDHSNMDHGDHSNRGDDSNDPSHAEMMNMMYDTLIVNGKTSPAIEAIEVTEDDTIKLRFVNTGLFTQVINIPGHEFKVTHYDGQQVNEPELISDTAIRIAPAERYDVEIQMDQPGAWGIEVYAEENENLRGLIPLVYTGFADDELETAGSIQTFLEITDYGSAMDFNLGEITKEFDMILSSNDGGETFKINDKQMTTKDFESHEDHEIYEVEEGDVVKVNIVNDTDVDHPMHLHGHFFYVISRNGEHVTGSPIKKETLNVRPNESYEIVFVADNPGNWMFHCHELHHASGGMVSEVRYYGYTPAFTPDPNVPNKPE